MKEDGGGGGITMIKGTDCDIDGKLDLLDILDEKKFIIQEVSDERGYEFSKSDGTARD